MALWVNLVRITALTAEKVSQTNPLNMSTLASNTHIYSLFWKK